MILKCETYFRKVIIFNEKIKILNSEKQPIKKDCHGNATLYGQALATLNCSQIHFRKSYQVWLYIEDLISIESIYVFLKPKNFDRNELM